MNRYLNSSTAVLPLGLPTGQKCLMVPAGQYAGRTALLYAVSSTTIELISVDPPYTSPADPQAVVTDSANFPFDAWMDDDGDIYIAYTVSSSLKLGFVKLTFSGGQWSAGSPVSVFDAGESYFQNICKLSSGQLWIVYTRISGENYFVSAKNSSDDGQSWGVVSDPGDTLTNGADFAFGRMVELNGYQYLFYTDGGERIAYKTKANSSAVWSGENILGSEGGYNERFSARASADGRIGLAYVAGSGLKFREFTGSHWTGEATIDTGTISSPSPLYLAGEPCVVYGKDKGGGMTWFGFSRRDNGQFTAPEILDVRKAELKSLLLYSESAGTYEDKTGEAASSMTADIFHAASGSLLADSGDTIFFGIDQPFNLIRLLLSTPGTGGEVGWKYWDGLNWKAFVPESGAWSFSESEKDILFWPDFNSVPSDWQKKTIAGEACFWISASVVNSFTTAPVGSRITAWSRITLISPQV